MLPGKALNGIPVNREYLITCPVPDSKTVRFRTPGDQDKLQRPHIQCVNTYVPGWHVIGSSWYEWPERPLKNDGK
jgi:hypothetical protein